MKITIESTEKTTRLDSVEVRVWEGVTEDGVPCHVFVHRLCVREDNDAARFDAELQAKLPPGRYIPLSLML
jgi:hypothetical protein